MGGVVSFQNHFEAQDDDLLLASCPKSGTTWLKALALCIVNRSTVPLSSSPLLASNPHTVVPTLEFDVYNKHQSVVDLDDIPRPRLLSTHLPYEALPASIKSSKCKIVYIWRSPMDQAVSLWHFLAPVSGTGVGVGEHFFASFCRGVHSFGPFWEHVLGFWKAKQQQQDEEEKEKIMFVKYEELKQDTPYHVKRLAEFLGFPFSEAEEKRGAAEQIAHFCSLESMKSFEANSDGFRLSGMGNSSFFRKGQVGDWLNHLTPSMAERLEKLVHEKFKDTGLTF